MEIPREQDEIVQYLVAACFLRTTGGVFIRSVVHIFQSNTINGSKKRDKNVAEERKAPAETKCNNRGAELLVDEMQAAVTKRCHGTAAGEQRRRRKRG